MTFDVSKLPKTLQVALLTAVLAFASNALTTIYKSICDQHLAEKKFRYDLILSATSSGSDPKAAAERLKFWADLGYLEKTDMLDQYLSGKKAIPMSPKPEHFADGP